MSVRRKFLNVHTVGVVLMTALALAAPALATDITPIFIAGNPTCQALGFQNEFKVDPPSSGTYTIPGTTETVTVTSDGTYFDWISTLGMDGVIAKGGPNANLFRYDPPAESFGDTGLYSPINPENGRPYGLSHISFCYDWEVAVAKTATTSFTRTWQWDILKTAVPASWNLFSGDTGTTQYAVTVTKSGYTDTNFAVAGTITVTNDTPFAATLTGVADSVEGIPATVDCPAAFPYTLAAGATLECTYSAALPNNASRVNTATVTTTGTVLGGSGTAAVTFGAPTTEVNGAVNVGDTNGSSWTFNDTGTVSYTRTFDCSSTGTFPNTATIVETGQSSSASVTVACFGLQVSKTALASYDRDYPWTLEKSVTPAAWDLFNGDTGTSQYTVTATRGAAVESDFAASGIITVVNQNPARAAVLTSISDVISGPIAANVTCGVTFPYLLGGGSTLQCSYSAALPDKATRTNTATAVLQNFNFPPVGEGTPSGSSPYTGSASVDFAGATVNETNAALTVNDSFAGAGSPWTFAGTGTQTYSRTFACGADGGSHVNIVTAMLADGTVLSDQASVAVTCSALTVTKTAAATYTRTYPWEIAKTADPASWNLFDGDSGTTEYTVTVTKGDGVDSAFGVSGSISISNPSATRDATLTSVADLVSPDIGAAVNCPSMTVAKSSTLTCTYSVALPDTTQRTNTASATQQNYAYTSAGVGAPSGTTSYSGNAGVVFGDPTTEVNGTVHVSDSNGVSWTFTESGTQTYTEPFDCGSVAWSGTSGTYTHPNIAEILETDQTASASVAVQCYRLAVTKDADTAYRRTWNWTIDKSADQTSLLLSAGQQFQVNYSVAMGATYTDDQFTASGDIFVTNPNPDRDAVLSDVSDVVTGPITAAVTCPSYTVVAGSTLTCTYTVGLPDTAGRLNTAAAIQQNFSYAADGTATAAGTALYSGTAEVIFGAPTEIADECVTVGDVFQSTPADLGQVCADELPKTFTYSHFVGPYDTCGEFTVENTASFETNDSATTGSDSWTVTASVPCASGCTLTPGYWKTHSSYGPAPYDDTWLQVGEDTTFFLSGQSHYQVLWTAPQGNVYYILAHAYIAAQLNQLNGASIPDDVLEAFQDATALFGQYTPAEVAALKGKSGNDTRALFVYYAYILDQYNNGLAVGGPPHCSE